MSSILKALKKLDDDLPRKRRAVIWPSRSTPRKAIRRWDIGSGQSTSLLWGLLAVAVIIVVGGIFLYFKPTSDDETDTVATVKRSISLPSQKVSVPKTSSPPPVRPQPKRQSPQASAPAPPAKTQPKPVVPADKPASAPVVKKKPPPPVKKPPPTIKKPAQPKGPAMASLPVLKSELELQAISWAPAAGDRLAVINGNIVREGASLEGYVIVQIDKDEVAVRKGAEQWKLVFDLK